MSDQAYQFMAILAYFIVMICIGLWANSKTKNLDDYMLGGRNLKPGVAALSAGASDMSGWLLMGLPGAVYLSGLVEAWLAIGLTAGAWVNWKIVAPRLRAYTEVSHNSITIPSFLDNRLKGNTRVLRVISGVIILVFFTFYVSSGMVAGGVFFQSSFGTSYLTGMLLVAGVTVLYTFFGGFLGASYTDLFQGLLMLIALLLVPIVGVFLVGGPGEMVNRIEAVNPDALSLFAGGTAVGIISSLAWGLGYFGQPHIIVRFMALRTPADAKAGRRIGIGWMLLTVLGAIGTALVGLAYYGNRPGEEPTDPEAIFLDMSQVLFHPLVAGFVLAAVLAAIMSTISSQLIVSSSALVEDLCNLAAKRTPSPQGAGVARPRRRAARGRGGRRTGVGAELHHPGPRGLRVGRLRCRLRPRGAHEPVLAQAHQRGCHLRHGGGRRHGVPVAVHPVERPLRDHPRLHPGWPGGRRRLPDHPPGQPGDRPRVRRDPAPGQPPRGG